MWLWLCPQGQFPAAGSCWPLYLSPWFGIGEGCPLVPWGPCCTLQWGLSPIPVPLNALSCAGMAKRSWGVCKALVCIRGPTHMEDLLNGMHTYLSLTCSAHDDFHFDPGISGAARALPLRDHASVMPHLSMHFLPLCFCPAKIGKIW